MLCVTYKGRLERQHKFCKQQELEVFTKGIVVSVDVFYGTNVDDTMQKI